jgi:hypothetical protein
VQPLVHGNSPCRSAPPAVAALLLECIRQLGSSGSNPVLEILKDVPQFVQRQKYPQPALAFGGGRWRAYYHSHPLDGCAAEEHGHFHLFVQQGRADGSDDWTHLAALAMDREGQPLRWFATNRWVTGGCWSKADWLRAAIDALVPPTEPHLLQRWLAAMLTLYASELSTLLEQRDAALRGWRQNHPADDALADRRLYELAQMPIDLVSQLASQLTGGPP